MGRVMESSTADPVPTSVQFYLAALLSISAWREICRCFIFSPHKQMHQAKPSQAADCQMHEKKNVLFRPKLCILDRLALSKVFKQCGCLAFLGKTDHPLCFAFTVGLSHPKPLGTQKKLSQFITFCIIEIHKHTFLKNTSEHACFCSTSPPN